MYAQYWNLETRPFENDQDAAFFFRSRTHQAALLKFKYLLDSGKGAGMLCGPTGVGKTYLTRMLMADQRDEPFGPFITVRYPFLNPSEMVAWLAAELGSQPVQSGREPSADQSLRDFEAGLRSQAERGRHPVLIIDEAHLIEDQRTLQALQLLLNYRDEYPFSLILCGQPVLLSRVMRLPELDERMAVKSLLQPFSREETLEYITHRLAVAGVQTSMFDEPALHEIHELSGGLARRINRIADLALLVGYADSLSSVSGREIDSVAEEIGLTCESR